MNVARENELRDNLTEIGIDISPKCEIYTAGMATRDYLKKKLDKNPKTNYSIGIIGENRTIRNFK